MPSVRRYDPKSRQIVWKINEVSTITKRYSAFETRSSRQSSFQVVSQQENKKGFAEQSRAGHKFFRQGKVGSYRRVLSDDQIAKVIDNHRELMVEMGYLDKNGKLKV